MRPNGFMFNSVDRSLYEKRLCIRSLLVSRARASRRNVSRSGSGEGAWVPARRSTTATTAASTATISTTPRAGPLRME